MKRLNFVVLAAVCAAILSSCKSSNDANEAYSINTFSENPYLAEIWWGEDYDEAASMDILAKHYNVSDSTDTASADKGGACSSWHKDNFHGRNIDWTMRDYATIIVHTPKNEAKGVKYASVGLIAGNPKFTKDFIHNNKVVPDEYRSWLPATIVDGMNECGLIINHNIVPYDGKPYEKNGKLTSMMLCRFVLDHFATAKEAVDSLSKMTVTQAVVKIGNDYSHFMLSDKNSSYVVEWIDGKFTATEFKSDGKGNYVSAKGEPAIMTNYFVGEAEKYGLASNAFFHAHPTALGVERAQLIMKQLPEAKTVEDHLNICKSVWYRQFCQGKTQWYTDNAGNYGYDEQKGKAWWKYPSSTETHWMANGDIYAAAKELLNSADMQGYYKDFNTKWDKCDPKNTYWYTQHSVVYDVNALKGYLIMQEGINSDKVVELSVK